MTVWTALLVIASSAAALWLLRKQRSLKWFVASVPCWMASSSGWFEFAGAMLTLLGIIAFAVGPTLPGRRKSRGNAPPLPHLANGPLTTVPPLSSQIGRTSRVLTVLTIVVFCLAGALGLWAAAGVEPELTGALALSAAIIGATFAFSNWFNGRVRVRIDQQGLHSRVFFTEQTIPWNTVGGITLRYLFMPGMGVRVVYYVVFSETHEFAFASSMKRAKEMQVAIEQAVGMTFPEPEITATM